MKPTILPSAASVAMRDGSQLPYLDEAERSATRSSGTIRYRNANLEQQVRGLVNIVGQFGIQDAFMIDALADDIAKSHDKMTNRGKDLFKNFTLKQGTQPDCRYDVLVKNYDSMGRDLLIEAKPDPDRGAVRIAIGQLFDYRRALPHRIGTDLAILTISRPPQRYVDLLLDLQVSVLWFDSEVCSTLKGEGKAWASVQKSLELLNSVQSHRNRV